MVTAAGALDAARAWLTEQVASNPELVVAAAIGAVVLAAGAYVLRQFRRPLGVRFVERLADEEAVTILMHPNPDPDAMATAIGIGALAEQVDTASTIQYPGQIRHQENRAFRNVLDLDLEQMDHVTDLEAESVVLVDHNEPRGFTGADGVLPFAVVDHHPGEGTGDTFTDVRTDYGASASIVAEYFEDVGGDPVPPDKHESEVDAEFVVPSQIATGLLYGILTDTQRLTAGCSSADFAAAGYLYPGVDEDLLDRIANPQVSKDVLEAKARAIAARKIEGSFAVSDIGSVSNVDAIPQAADELLRLEGVTAVVVIGECNGTMHLSGRSRDDRVHMGRALDAAVSEYGDASAGGHARMGGGQIPLDEVAVGADGGQQLQRSTLVDRLFETMAGDV